MEYGNLNVVSAPRESQLIKLTDLENDIHYKVSDLREVKTTWGRSFIVDFHDGRSMFLPKRVNDYLHKHSDVKNRLLEDIEKEKLALKSLDGRGVEFINIK